ncbi:MAG: hypothetical protein JXC32_21895 [Anaerolineae bacterium]|nr:hypothetical protein [Anaerolineae bacterium]
MSEEKPRPRPRYRGTYKHIDKEGGYAIWTPMDWEKMEMSQGHHGFIFLPDRRQPATFLSTEKVVLDYSVTMDDVPVLREGFQDGLNSLPDIDIESQDETVTQTLKMFEAKFTFTDDGVTRKRWLRLIYWAEGQLIVMAQGATPEDYHYWLPMFFNSLMTIEFGPF